MTLTRKTPRMFDKNGRRWTMTPARKAHFERVRQKRLDRQRRARDNWTSGPSRRIGRYTVYVAEDGRPFVLSRRVDGRATRKFGELDRCENCGGEMFRLHTGGARWTNCSKTCGAARMRRSKRSASLAKGGPKKEQLDRWFSLIVRSAGVCARCGSTENLQCAHIISRRYVNVRYDPLNAMCLCAKCHMFMTYRPLHWESFVLERIGAEVYADLRRRAMSNDHLDRVAVARGLYDLAESRGLDFIKRQGWTGWRGLRDPEAHHTYGTSPGSEEAA